MDLEQQASLDRAQAILSSSEADGEPTPERLVEVGKLGEAIVAMLQTVYDPEIPVDIYEMGLIYKIDIHDDNSASIDMTLTSPHCPVAEILPGEVQQKVASVEGVSGCTVDIVWEPSWHPSMMSEEAQLELGMIY